MSYESESVDKLTALYESQSPSAFIAFAMEGLPETDHNERYDKGDHEGASKCNYCCCDDRGCCSTPGWYGCLVGGVVVCVICCFVSCLLCCFLCKCNSSCCCSHACCHGCCKKQC